MPQTSSPGPAPAIPLLDRLIGLFLVLIAGLVALREWGGPAALDPLLFALLGLLVAGLFVKVRAGRKGFVLAALALTGALVWRGGDWQEVVLRATRSAAFICAFFTALATLRSAAEPSPAIRAGGSFLARQPPGRRYLALTMGGSAFAFILNYGAISLLGSLATAAAQEEPDAEIRNHRRRRMLLAIQRGFISSLPWSPLSFAIAITTALIPGTSWGSVLLPALGTALLMTLIGWGLDTLFKPRLTNPPVVQRPEGSWALMLPLLALLVILAVSVLVLGALTGIRVVGLVLVIVPVMALIWAALQSRGGGAPLRRRLSDYCFREMPGYRGEVLLLMMAGYIGTVAAPLLVPLVKASGFHPEELPSWLVLAGLVWVIPLAGQFAMNPILAVTLIAPLLPTPAELGVTPTALVTAITAGWALSGISSPFTATTLLIGSFANVGARHVGLRWNGAYMLCALATLPLWVLAYAYLLS
ncbi:hypothetical protein M4578_01270 [Salipiger sp. P9]|uniref:hypothetical protein n=1 Tax=Salipiger pentaromativorans TaxID=2943193 RepID=UPI0021571AF8|nr:hypothetical protein [Salipiger pentaromativorans]MCR8546441.1 hypothetical protein [Salipiger pentaromativorans]